MLTADIHPRFDLLTDAAVLDRFVKRGDQEAFAALVQRHGPLVLGVCRRVLRQEHDAEDAFQATFIVLARKAGAISKYASIASWLYKVAYRIAVRAKLVRARRCDQEQKVLPKECESGLADVVRHELQQVLDEEVRRLPEKYRAPILLCYLQGQTNEQAATLLHCPTGTLKIRLLRGRELLRKRLVKRGLALSAMGILVGTLAEMAQAAVPAPLQVAAAQAGLAQASPAVTGLAQAALKGMCLAKLKVAAALLLTVALLGLADGMMNLAAGSPTPYMEKQLMPTDPAPTAIANDRVAQRSEP